MTLSTHVLDTELGRPVVGLRVEVVSPHGITIEGVTDADGRIRELVPADQWGPGTWTIGFVTDGHSPYYPFVNVAINVDDDSHHHVPLLLARHGYTTYRGS
jgi:5-hydroxyisourate hydrolase